MDMAIPKSATVQDLNKNHVFVLVLNTPLSQVDKLSATQLVALFVGGKDPPSETPQCHIEIESPSPSVTCFPMQPIFPGSEWHMSGELMTPDQKKSPGDEAVTCTGSSLSAT
jgi:hypothetical protein